MELGRLSKAYLLPTLFRNIRYPLQSFRQNYFYSDPTVFWESLRRIKKFEKNVQYQRRGNSLFGLVRRDYFGKWHDQGFVSTLFFILSFQIIQYVILYFFSEAAVGRYSSKTVFLKMLQYSQENTNAGVCPAGLQLYYKETPTQVLPYEYCDIFKNSFFYISTSVAASVHSSETIFYSNSCIESDSAVCSNLNQFQKEELIWFGFFDSTYLTL